MRIEQREINGEMHDVMTADPGKTFRRIHDGFYAGDEVPLGMDCSVKPPRPDKPEYYEEVNKPDYPELAEGE